MSIISEAIESGARTAKLFEDERQRKKQLVERGRQQQEAKAVREEERTFRKEESALARAGVREERRVAKREDYLADATKTSRQISSMMQPLATPGKFKQISKTSSTLGKAVAIDDSFEDDNPLKGIVEHTQSNVSDLSALPEAAHLSGKEIVDIAFKQAFDERRIPAYEYKKRSEAGIMGSGFFADEKGALPGYEDYIAETPDPYEATKHALTPGGMAGNFAIGAGLRAAGFAVAPLLAASSVPAIASIGASLAIPTGGASLAISAAVIAGAAFIPEMIAFDFANDAVQDTDWAKKHQVEGEVDRTDLLGFAMGVGVAGAGRKAFLATKSRFKNASEQLVKDSKIAVSAENTAVNKMNSKAGNPTGEGDATAIIAVGDAQANLKKSAEGVTKLADDVINDKPVVSKLSPEERIDSVLKSSHDELGTKVARELEVDMMAEREAFRESGVDFGVADERKVVSDFLAVKDVEASNLVKEGLSDVVKGKEIPPITPPGPGAAKKIQPPAPKLDKTEVHTATVADVSTHLDDIKSGDVALKDVNESVAAQLEVNAVNAKVTNDLDIMSKHLGFVDEVDMAKNFDSVLNITPRTVFTEKVVAKSTLGSAEKTTNKNVGWLHQPAPTTFDIADPSQRLAALRKASGSTFGTIKGFEDKAAKSTFTRELVYAADNAKVVEESLMKNSLTETVQTKPDLLKSMSMKENAATSASKAGKLAAIMGTTVSLVTLSGLSPEEAEAGGIDKALKVTGIVLTNFFKDFGPGAMKRRVEIAKEMAETQRHFIHAVSEDGNRVIQGETPNILKDHLAKGKNLQGDLLRGGTGDGTITREFRGKMTLAQAFTDLYHDAINPAVQFIGGLQHGNALSHLEQEVSLAHIMAVRGIKPGHARGAVRKKMGPVAQELSDVHVKMQDSGQLYKSMSATLENKSALMPDGVREKLLKATIEHGKIYDKSVNEYAKIVKEKYEPVLRSLAEELPETRIFMLLDGAEKKNPWLTKIVTKDERVAAARLRVMMDDKAGALKEVGVNTFRKDYVFHSIHPDVDVMASIKKYPDLVKKLSQHKSIPFSRYHSRAEHTVATYPEISGTLEKYFPQTNKIIQTRKFMQSGWEEHMGHIRAHGTTASKDAWELLEKSMIPVDNTLSNQIFNRLTSIEVARVLAGSTSVAFKHGLKVVGDVGVLGPSTTLSMYNQAVRSAAINKGREGLFGRGLTVLGVKPKSDFISDYIRTFSNQEKFRSTITELGVDPISLKSVDRILDNINDVGSIFVSSIEHVDRGVSTLGSLYMASKKGLTPDQAGFAAWDVVLRTNFMAGANNPAWLKSPAARFFLMFQGTPFKIAEQRIVNALRAKKDIAKAGGLLIDDLKELWAMRGIAEQGSREIKWGLITDALKADRDVFGTPHTKIFMRNLIALGSVGTFSAATGLHVWEQVVHPPFIKVGEDTLNLSTNTVVQAALKAYGNKEESDDMFFHRMYHKWAGGAAPIPVMAKKTWRLTQNDIPERYKGSKFAYLLGVAQSD